jgi:Tfp pilus assembly protein FimT
MDGDRTMKMSKGFSLFELTFIVGILVVVGLVAIPNMVVVISNARVRAGVTSMSGLLQNARMSAVKVNKTLTTHFGTEGTATLVGYVKEASDTSDRKSTDLQAEWEAPVFMMGDPDDYSGGGAPSEITDTTLGFTPVGTEPSFNTRGLPCVFTTTCTSSGFLYYFKDTSQPGSKGWAALSISPAGRIKKWFWTGTDWTD